jgi:hypothetical protein
MAVGFPPLSFCAKPLDALGQGLLSQAIMNIHSDHRLGLSLENRLALYDMLLKILCALQVHCQPQYHDSHVTAAAYTLTHLNGRKHDRREA